MNLRNIRALGAIVLFTWSIWAAPWKDWLDVVGDRGDSFAAKRVRLAFQGVPVDDIATKLNEVLPSTAPIALGPSVRSDLVLILTEALYPRIVDRRSRVLLECLTESEYRIANMIPLAQDSSGKKWVLSYSEGLPPPPSQGASRKPNYRLSWLTFFAAVIGLSGLGGFAFFRLDMGCYIVRVAAAILGGLFVVSVLAMVATWIQFPLELGSITVVGVVFFLWLAIRYLRSAGLRTVVQRFHGKRFTPLGWIFVAMTCCFLWQVALRPITLWDGRSVWLFHAKRLHYAGMMLKQDLLHQDSQWAHSDYPLFYPTLLAYFSPATEPFNERMAALGIGVCFGAAVILLWRLTMACLGTCAATAIAVTWMLLMWRLTAGGYADGILTLLLGCEFFGLLLGSRRIGLVAAGAAAITKLEGLIFALVILIVLDLVTRAAERGATYKRVLEGMVVLPAVVHLFWSRAIGLAGTYPSFHRIKTTQELLYRLKVMLAETSKVLTTGGYLNAETVIWQGFVFAVAGLVILAYSKTGRSRATWAAVAIILLSLVFVLFNFLVTPYDVQWHVASSIDRLLFLPSLIGMALFFLATCKPPLYGQEAIT
ncbi:MAG TPA: hypothetical protein VGK99_14040 [Acidobacteriota bacterium]|jgi:hypothetical protein